jgi:hypothetical protein
MEIAQGHTQTEEMTHVKTEEISQGHIQTEETMHVKTEEIAQVCLQTEEMMHVKTEEIAQGHIQTEEMMHVKTEEIAQVRLQTEEMMHVKTEDIGQGRIQTEDMERVETEEVPVGNWLFDDNDDDDDEDLSEDSEEDESLYIPQHSRESPCQSRLELDNKIWDHQLDLADTWIEIGHSDAVITDRRRDIFRLKAMLKDTRDSLIQEEHILAMQEEELGQKEAKLKKLMDHRDWLNAHNML